MRVLVFSRAFAPSLGGLEEVARICCEHFVDIGHQVEVITESESDDDLGFRYAVHRRITRRKKLQLCRKADVVLMFNISIRDIAYPIAARRPLVISHQGGYLNAEEPLRLSRHLKMVAVRLASGHIACSDAVAGWIKVKAVTIPNTYDDAVFKARPELPRSKDILFVGRLVSDKGADLLLDAVADSRVSKFSPTVTVVGEGPELLALKEQANRLQLNVTFAGRIGGEALGQVMNEHKILVVPSRWEEPFGIVALEGVASGCRVIVSDGGGLPAAVGPTGVTFPNNKLDPLIEAIGEQLEAPPELNETSRQEHLLRHVRSHVCQKYNDQLLAHCNTVRQENRNAA